MAVRVGRLPVDGPERAKVVRTKVLASGLYGCETSRVSDQDMRTFRDTVAKAVAVDSGHAAKDSIFTVASYGNDVDPYTEVMVRRVAALRRAIALRPGLLITVKRIFRR